MAEDAASWYQRRMSQMRHPSVPQQRSVPQYQQPQPQYQQPPQQVEHYHPIQGQTPESLTELLDMQAHGQGPKQGKGARLNPEPCPSCGGSLYYADLGMKRRGPPPAPRCFTCGYNELFEQGLKANWQGGA